MKQSNLWLALGVVGLLSAPLAYADETTDDDVTVADQGQTADDIASKLPEQASDAAAQHAAFGQGVASQARDEARNVGREFGQQTAGQVRQDMQQSGPAATHRR